MAIPSINQIQTFHEGTFYVWTREPCRSAGYRFLSSENGRQEPSPAHWSRMFSTFELAEAEAKAEKKRAKDREDARKRSGP